MTAICSMTGFGSGTTTATSGAVARVEIRSVNNRGSKISVRSRPALNEYEKNLRDLIAEHLRRGSIDITVNINRQLAATSAMLTASAGQTVAMVRQVAADLQITGDLTVSDLLHLPGLFTEIFNEPISEDEWCAVNAAARAALRQIGAMRENEGRATAARLYEILLPIESFRDLARKNSAQLVEKQRAKLQTRLQEIGLTRDLDQQSLERELVFFADRVDINEELDRLGSHLEQFRALLKNGGEIGKRLEFIAQEFLREINTAASKANDITITAAAVEAKTAVEKLKEQTANLE